MRPAGVGFLKLAIDDEIASEAANTVSRYLAMYHTHSVELTIDTVGGDWASSKSIFESLVRHRRSVTAILFKAASGGALIAMAADHRVMAPTGYFFLHRPDGNYAKAVLDSIADRKAALMAARCRVPASRFRRWMDETTTINAERALTYGLVHEVPGLRKPQRATVFL